jgi:hypothetical protein
MFIKIKAFFNKIINKISDFWESEDVQNLRDDFIDFAVDFAAKYGKEVFENVLTPFIIQQVKNYAKDLIHGDVKFEMVKKEVKSNFKDIDFKDYILNKLIEDVVFELKVTKQI